MSELTDSMNIKIYSGGQTGADRGGLNAAIAEGIEHGGYCPVGRMSEDGAISQKYHLTEYGKGYKPRTVRNVKESCASLILVRDRARMTPGSRFTVNTAARFGKLYMVANIATGLESIAVLSNEIVEWIRLCPDPEQFVLNVAGSRESSAPGIQQNTTTLIRLVLRTLAVSGRTSD